MRPEYASAKANGSAKGDVATVKSSKNIVRVNLSKSKTSNKVKTKKIASSKAPAKKKIIELSFAGQGSSAGAEIEPLPQKVDSVKTNKAKKKPVRGADKSKTIVIKSNAEEAVSAAPDPFFHKPEVARQLASIEKTKPTHVIKLYKQFQKATEQEIEDNY